MSCTAWCFLTTDSFAATILRAANLGADADTAAAVCGQIAGAHYGQSGIPAHWLERLTMREEIASLADRLYSSAERRRLTCNDRLHHSITRPKSIQMRRSLRS